MASFRFAKQAKLIKTDEFSSVFNFRKRISAKHLVIHYQPNVLQHPRLGLVVGKKIAKLAVSRNYMRRVLRELFRLHQHEISHADVIVRVQKKFSPIDYSQINQEFDTLVAQLNLKLNAKLNAKLITPQSNNIQVESMQ